MNRISIDHAAQAMELEAGALRSLLDQWSIPVSGDWLEPDALTALTQYLEQQQNDAIRQSQDKLEWLVGRYTLMIDTCSLLHPQFPDFARHVMPVLRRHGKSLIVPSGVVEELKSLLGRKPELQSQVLTAAGALRTMQADGVLRIYGSSGESFGDQQLLTAATRFLTTSELLIITQDNALSADLMHLNRLGSVRGKGLGVSRINRYGYLSRYIPQEGRFTGSGSGGVAPVPPIPAAPLVEGGGELLPVAHLPSGGDQVQGASGLLRLGAALGSGGEGTIYDLGDGTVAKIYHPEKLTAARRDKLALMAGHPAPCDGVCWPQELLYTPAGEFVGYRMARASGKELQRCVFTRKTLEECFPGGKKEDMVRLAITILEKICALHRAGVLLGDINLTNILVVSPEQVWFVDCDSYQVGGYPCPVGKSYFIPPELQGKNFSTFLRTPGNEAFAVATLLFMLMLPGKGPYAQQGSGRIEEAIRAMEFPYPCGENGKEHTPEGSWRFQWSHLPRFLKEYFYGTFQRGGAYSTEDKRLPDYKWLSAFRHYHQLLAAGKLQAQDPQSGELFPTRWKCLDAGDQEVSEHRTCVECGEEFDITVNERKYYEQHSLVLPRRCPACRKRRKLCQSSLTALAS